MIIIPLAPDAPIAFLPKARTEFNEVSATVAPRLRPGEFTSKTAFVETVLNRTVSRPIPFGINE